MVGIGRVAAAIGVLVACALSPSPVLARWLRADSPRFTVYSNGDEAGLREDVEALESFDTLMRRLHRLDQNGVPPRKLIVYLVSNHAELERLPEHITPYTAGFYSARPAGIYAVAIRQRGVDPTLLHEYTHHFMWQYFAYGYPAWFVEGYAEYFMTAQRKGDAMQVGRPNENRGAWLLTGRWVPLATLLTAQPLAISKSNDQAMYYAEAWLLTHYLRSTPERNAALQAYLTDLGHGAAPDTALAKAMGQPLEAIDADLKRYMRGKLTYHIVPLKAGPSSEITVTTLPPSADAVLLDLEPLREGRSSPEILARARKTAQAYPDDPLAQRVLAMAERLDGHADVADAILDKRLAADPKDVEALELRALALMEEGDEQKDGDKLTALYRRAAALLVRANRVESDRFQTLYAYARARSVEDDYPSDNVLEALLAAHEYAPQVGDVTFLTAQVVARKGDPARAARMLGPLANDPHGGDAAEAAREMVKRYTEQADAKPASNQTGG